jgi:hypothetical protein
MLLYSTIILTRAASPLSRMTLSPRTIIALRMRAPQCESASWGSLGPSFNGRTSLVPAI